MVRRCLWQSKRFGMLASDSARYLFFYFLTCPHQNSIGCFRLPPHYALSDLALNGANWDLGTLASGIAELEEAELILSDAGTGEILICGWWRDNGPTNDSWFKGALRQCGNIQSSRLRDAALDALRASYEASCPEQDPPHPSGTNGASGDGVSSKEKIEALLKRMGKHSPRWTT